MTESNSVMKLAILSPNYNEVLELVARCRSLGVEVMHVDDASQILAVLKNGVGIDMFVTKLGKHGPKESPWEIVKYLRQTVGNEETFICFYSFKAATEISYYDRAANYGVNMVTSSIESVFSGIFNFFGYFQLKKKFINFFGKLVIQKILQHQQDKGGYECPYCGIDQLTEDNLVEHVPLFHTARVNEKNRNIKCPICNQSQRLFPVHLHNYHGHKGREPAKREFRGSIASKTYTRVVCKRSDGKILLIREIAGYGWGLPGGAVDPGELPTLAAVRECVEEAEIRVLLDGVINIDFNPLPDATSIRFVFLAHPIDEKQLCKQIPDYESGGAIWASYEEAQNLKFRSRTSLTMMEHVYKNLPVAPLSVLTVGSSPVVSF